jgi:hypothetical protein
MRKSIRRTTSHRKKSVYNKYNRKSRTTKKARNKLRNHKKSRKQIYVGGGFGECFNCFGKGKVAPLTPMVTDWWYHKKTDIMKEDGKYVYEWKKMNDCNTAHVEKQYLLWNSSARNPKVRALTTIADLVIDPRAEDDDPAKYQGNALEWNWKIIFDDTLLFYTQPTNHLLQNREDETNKIKIMRTERRETDVPTPPREVDGQEYAQYNLVPQALDGAHQAPIFPNPPYVHSHPSPPSHLSVHTQRMRPMCRGGVPPTHPPPVADVLPPADGFPSARIRRPVRLPPIINPPIYNGAHHG